MRRRLSRESGSESFDAASRIARSIGSNGWSGLARSAQASRARVAGGRVCSGAAVRSSPATSSASDMRFSVSVPVLSVHSTVTEPSASMAGARRTSAFCLAMRHAPSARNTVSTTGNSSGILAIARVTPASRPCSQPPRIATYSKVISRLEPRPSAANRTTARRISSCMGVAGERNVRNARPIRPTAVSVPMAVISAEPWPATTRVLACIRLSWRSSPGEAERRTGTDSPVSMDSSSIMSSASRMRASAGTRSPSATSIVSPTTNSRAATHRIWPSRSTHARGLLRSRNA